MAHDKVSSLRAAACALAAFVTTAALLAGCDAGAPAPRHMAQVKLLPDTPPPPPPPKPEEKKPEPQKDEHPQPQVAQPKPQAAPQPQALKSDEAAGDGPGNGLQAGSVTQDYTNQKIGTGTVIGGGTADTGTRLAANSFANAATRALNEYLARDRELKRADYHVDVLLWLTPHGAMQRFELLGGTGDSATDDALRTALEHFPGPGSAPPERMPQPLRLLVTNRMIG